MLPLAALLMAAGPAASPFPTGDGFVYPGQPGSEGMEAYYQRWSNHGRSLGPPPSSDRLKELYPLLGEWQVELCEFDGSAKGPGIRPVSRGTAKVTLTADGRWLMIQADLPGYTSIRLIGADRRGGLVLEEAMAPGATYRGAASARGWTGDRLVFAGTSLDYHGLELVDRRTLVREGHLRWRMVVEARLASGRYMAADDMLFTR